MSAEQAALIPQCAECLAVWMPTDEERWRAYLDTDSELVFYCPGVRRAGVRRQVERARCGRGNVLSRRSS